MLKTVALVGTGIVIGCCYKSFKKDPQKSKNKNLDKPGKGNEDTVKE